MDCPACGTTNPVAARYCPECGAALAGERSPGTRKTLTVLCCDVVGSTALGEAHDPELVRAVMTRYYAAMRAAIEAHGGRLEKFIGDAVLAVFGIPTAHEDDALRAARAALAMQAAVGPLNAMLAVERGVTIAIRIGISSGEVMVGEAMAGGTYATGDAVNTAARLQAVAGPGEVLLDAATLTLLGEAVDSEPVPDVSAKGKAASLAAWRLRALSRGPARAVRDRAPMLGRETELAAVLAIISRAHADRQPLLVTIVGAAGVGKSRLVRETLAAQDPAVTVLTGRCLAYGEGITWWPLREIVLVAAGIGDADAAEVAQHKLGALVAKLGAEARITDLVAAAIGLVPESAVLDEIGWALQALLEALARRGPLLLVLEDLHWAEPALLDFLGRLRSGISEALIAVVATARPELLDERPGWGIGTGTSLLRLEHLDRVACDTLIAAQPGASALPGSLASRIADAAEGNPLFVEEMVGMLRDEGLLAVDEDGAWVLRAEPDHVRVPLTIRALLTARLDALPSGERESSRRASVIGRSFESDALAELSEPDHLPALARQLRSLVRREVLRPERAVLGEGDAFCFRHVLIRDAAYEGLAKADRAVLHERFADWLVAVAADRTAEYAQILGFHLAEAGRYRAEIGLSDEHTDALADRAAGWLVAAGRRAAWSGDTAAAVDLLDHAWAIAVEPERRFEVGHELAMLAVWADDLVRAGAIAAELTSLAGVSGSAVRQAMADVLRLWVGLYAPAATGSGTLVELGRVQGLAAILEAAGEWRGLAHAKLLEATVVFQQGLCDAAFKACATAVAAATRAGDRALESRLRTMNLMDVPWGPMPVEAGMALIEAEVAALDLQPVARGSASVAMSVLEAYRGNVEAARGLWQEGVDLIRTTGETYWSTNNAVDRLRIERIGGDYASAERVLREALRVAEDARGAATQPYLLAMLSEALAGQGEWEGAAASAGEALARCPADYAPHDPDWRTSRARVHLHAGEIDEARRLLSEAVALTEPMDALVEKGDIRLLLAQALRAAGDEVGACEAAERALACYEQKGATALVARVRAEWECPE